MREIKSTGSRNSEFELSLKKARISVKCISLKCDKLSICKIKMQNIYHNSLQLITYHHRSLEFQLAMKHNSSRLLNSIKRKNLRI